MDRSTPVPAPAPGRGRPIPPATADRVRDLMAALAGLTGVQPSAVLPAARGPLSLAAAQAALRTGWDAARDALTARLGDPGAAGEAAALVDLLAELRRCDDELREQQVADRESSFARVRQTLALLGDVESTTELVENAVTAVCHLGFDRAIVSRVENDLWVAESVYVGRDARWAEEILQASQENPQIVSAGLIEAEIVRTGRSVLVPDVTEVAAMNAVNRPIAEASLSRSYVAAPIVAHGAIIGFLHADCYYQGRELDGTDRETLALFGEGLGYALARTAVLDRLSALRAEVSLLSDSLLARSPRMWGSRPGGPTPSGGSAAPPRRLLLPGGTDGTGLTRREIDVLRWMARGETNAKIARRLVITEGTVKTHVQSILRKLGAANRAEAVSLWTQMEGRR